MQGIDRWGIQRLWDNTSSLLQIFIVHSIRKNTFGIWQTAHVESQIIGMKTVLIEIADNMNQEAY